MAKRQNMRFPLKALLAWTTLGLASSKPFSIHDDVLAYPQVRFIYMFDCLFWRMSLLITYYYKYLLIWSENSLMLFFLKNTFSNPTHGHG